MSTSYPPRHGRYTDGRKVPQRSLPDLDFITALPKDIKMDKLVSITINLVRSFINRIHETDAVPIPRELWDEFLELLQQTCVCSFIVAVKEVISSAGLKVTNENFGKTVRPIKTKLYDDLLYSLKEFKGHFLYPIICREIHQALCVAEIMYRIEFEISKVVSTSTCRST